MDLAYLHWASPNETYLDGAAERDWSRALYLHTCEQGHIPGCAAYAASYDGVGDESRADLSLDFYKRACDGGHGSSCQQAGFAYALGRDIPEDHVTAAMYALRGCALEDAYACHSVTSLHDVDPVLRAGLETLACVTGSPLGCEFAAETYARGLGVAKDLTMAKAFRGYLCALEQC